MTSKEIKNSIEELLRSDQVFVCHDDQLEVAEFEVREIEIDKTNNIDIFVIK